MDDLEPTKRRRGIVRIDGAMARIAVLLIMYVWLLSATLETLLAGHMSPVRPRRHFLWLAVRRLRSVEFFRGRSQSKLSAALTLHGRAQRPGLLLH